MVTLDPEERKNVSKATKYIKSLNSPTKNVIKHSYSNNYRFSLD